MNIDPSEPDAEAVLKGQEQSTGSETSHTSRAFLVTCPSAEPVKIMHASCLIMIKHFLTHALTTRNPHNRRKEKRQEEGEGNLHKLRGV